MTFPFGLFSSTMNLRTSMSTLTQWNVPSRDGMSVVAFPEAYWHWVTYLSIPSDGEHSVEGKNIIALEKPFPPCSITKI